MSKGKNFSANNASGKRKKSDAYFTPYSLTRLFLKEIDATSFSDPWYEPSCGEGAIMKVVNEFGIQIDGDDISQGKDFFKYTGRTYPVVITNPPFSLAYEFIKKAKEVSDGQIFFYCPYRISTGRSGMIIFGKIKSFH